MIKWSKKESSCKNCKTKDRRHISLGYCTKCYKLICELKKIKLIKINNFLKSRKWLHLYSDLNNKIFVKAKTEAIKQINDRLRYLKFRESKLQNNIEGLDLEFAFNWLAKQAGVRKNIYHGMAGWFEMTFNEEQRKQLMRQIDKIQQKVPWGVNWAQALTSANHVTEK